MSEDEERPRRRREWALRHEQKKYRVTVKSGQGWYVIRNVSAENCQTLQEAYENRSKLKKKERVVNITDQRSGQEVPVDVGKVRSLDITER